MLFAVPVVLYIEAESFDDAQKVANDWAEDAHNDLPEGIDGIDAQLVIDYSEDGDRIAYLPADDSVSDDDDDDDDDDDLGVDGGLDIDD